MRYLGFEPTNEQPYYFISYKTEDCDRVTEVTKALDQQNIPMWCDYGIPYDSKWSGTIAEKIHHCEAVIFFYSQIILQKENPYVIKEYRYARRYKKTIYVVLLDAMPDFEDVPYDYVDWIDELGDHQLVDGTSGNVDYICKELLRYVKQKPISTDNLGKQSVLSSKAENIQSPKLVKKTKIQDSSTTISNTLNYLPKDLNCKVGDIIFFGNYPQGANGEVKPIEWQVLEREGKSALLISRYALDCKPYNQEKKAITWAESDLHRFLNGEFLQKAFTEAEQKQIEKHLIKTANSKRYSPKGGAAVTDPVFLLSIEEAKQYFKDDESRKCWPTDYAKAKKTYVSETHGGTCWWWLRSPGRLQNYAAHVHTDGSVLEHGDDVYYDDYAVRPAIWICLESSATISNTLNSLPKDLNCKVGDIISFGNFPQGANGEVKPIEWQVLERKGKRALLISRYALDCKPYNKERKDITWAECDLHRFLNGEFLQKAFTEAEQKQIEKRSIKTPDNNQYGTKGGAAVTDPVFLLSIEEAKQYFKDDESGKCWPTDYAKAQGADGSEPFGGSCYWWLRSSGNGQRRAAVVYPDGIANESGNFVSIAEFAVRPALWLHLES